MISDLSKGEVDVWLVDRFDISAQATEAYLRLLDSAEQRRFERFVHARDKTLFLIAKAWTRTVLSLYEPTVKPEAWSFAQGTHGKPRITNAIPQHIEFNLSHTHSLIALAVCRNQSVGVDVENIGRTNNLHALAQQCFTEAEQQYVFASPPNQQRQRFFQLWTLKEAFVKATGQGIAAGLKSFEFSFDGQQIHVTGNNPDTHASWRFHQQSYAQHYSLAVACRAATETPRGRVRLFRGLPFEKPQLVHPETHRS